MHLPLRLLPLVLLLLLLLPPTHAFLPLPHARLGTTTCITTSITTQRTTTTTTTTTTTRRFAYYLNDSTTGGGSGGLGFSSATPPTGRVTLVGAGPGDPDLLTLAAVKALGTAELVIADRLIPGEILE
jgi:hypothetical protein